MNGGRTYEVFVEGKPVGLVGSTTQSLAKRCKNKYPKRFGPTVELRLIREIPRPEGYDDREFDFRLKAAEAFDIAQKKTYREDGGLNLMSPLVQALWTKETISEIGRMGGLKVPYEARVRGGKNGNREAKSRGGKTRARNLIESGEIKKLAAWGAITRDQKLGFFALSKEERRAASSRGGQTTFKKGLLGRGVTPESLKRAYQAGIGKMTREQRQASAKKAISGLLVKNPKGNGPQSCCLRWNIRRGKPCICGKHLVESAA